MQGQHLAFIDAYTRVHRRPPRSIEVLVPPEDLPVLQNNSQPVKSSVTGD
jgi:hypothetical protein